MGNRKSQIANRKWAWAALCVCAVPLLLLLAGCLLPERSYVATSYYSIDLPLPEAPPRKAADLSLAVRALDSASRYQERILFRNGGPAVGYHESERWVEPPAEMVTRALRRGLSGACTTCVVVDDRLVRRPDVVVEGRLTRFDQLRGGKQWSAACEVELVVKMAEERRVLLARRIAVTRPAREQTTRSFVEAMNAAVADLVAQAADAVDKALADHIKKAKQ